MFSNPFNFYRSNKTNIHAFLQSTFQDDWNYLEALGLNESDLQEATFEQIFNNPDDMVDGVTKVKMNFGTRFFNLFNNLIIKHRDEGSVTLMFYTEAHQAEDVLSFYNILKINLGGGYVKESKFSSFDEVSKVKNLSKGQYKTETDEIMNIWLNGNISLTLNYKIVPLRQLLFSVHISSSKILDLDARNKGTILNILEHNINEVILRDEIKAELTYENEKVKYVDYTFNLDPLELGIFEEVRVRIFDERKIINENIQTHVTYYSKFEIDTSSIIHLCDQVIKLYGKDSDGNSEMKPYELDLMDESDFWTGRKWLFNISHSLQDLSDPNQYTLYEVNIKSYPEEDGLCLNILMFNKMMDYQILMIP